MKTACIFASLLLTTVLRAQVPAPVPPLSDTRSESRVEPLKSGSKVWVKNRNGGIRVTGWDREELSLMAQISDSERRRIHLDFHRKGNDLEIEVVFRQGGWFQGLGPISSPKCEINLNVPRSVLGYFHTTNGTVNVCFVEGYARCESSNGDIRLQDISGEVRAETTNGSIDARHLRARIKGGTTNGRINLEEVEGGVELSTTNGSITARKLDGWGEGIRLESTNGGIHVELGRAGGDLRAENSNGSLDVRLPAAQSLEITKHSAHLRLPGRPQNIVLVTTNGGITVRP